MMGFLSGDIWTLLMMNSPQTHKLRLLLVLTVVLAGSSVQAQNRPQFIGNGRLTVGFDATGRVSSIQWPSPGYYSQLSDKGDQESGEPRGIGWGVDIGEKILWVGGEGWTLTRFEEVTEGVSVEVTYRYESLGIEADQTFWVGPNKDILHASIRVRGAETGGAENLRLIWYSDFDPTTQLTRLRKGGDPAGSEPRDFAAVLNEKANQIVQFRVRGAGSGVYSEVGKWLKEGRDYSGWSDLGEGTWIAYTSDQHVVQRSTGVVDGGVKGLLESGLRGSMGDTHTLMAIEPEALEGGFYGAVRVGFESRGRAVEALLSAADQSMSANRSVSLETHRFRSFRRNRFNLDNVVVRLFSKLDVMIDGDSGSVITNLGDDEYPYVVSAIEASYIVYALGLADSDYRAERLLDFLLDRIYMGTDGSVPLGSVAGLLFSNGEAASPHYEVDFLATASLLWGVEAYGRTVEGQKQGEYYRLQWESVEMMADFLDLWAQPLLRNRARDFVPGSAELETVTRDIASVYLGLEHAVRVAVSAGHAVPETWNRTRQRCYFFIRSRDLYVFAPWDIQYGFPKGDVKTTAEFPNRDALKGLIEDMGPFERAYLFASLGYQHRSAQQLSFSLETVIDGTLDDLLSSDITGYSSGRIAIILSMLYQSYH